jgi:hypothetical protein
MLRHLLSLTALTAILSFGVFPAQALDQTTAAGKGGIGRAIKVATGAGLNTNDGLAHPGLRTPSPGQLGITAGGATGTGTNRNADDGFHAAGMGKAITAGRGRSTMETVPGRSPIYIHLLGGTGISAQIGGR